MLELELDKQATLLDEKTLMLLERTSTVEEGFLKKMMKMV